ncbi:hypothetical protein RJ641_029968 [Dillenia turbinata]|uniref:Uncharacterized protein n=1 Tax=Dillenia turbinata TaxID=194707 RepID=A0AAN8W741_9MAGN
MEINPWDMINPERINQLRNVPGLGFSDSNDHTLKLGSKDDLTSKPGMLVQNPSPRIPLEHTSHSAEQASISSNRWEAGSIKPLLVRALRRVWPERPTISRFLPSKSIAKSLTMRSETFLEEDCEEEDEEAEERKMRYLE